MTPAKRPEKLNTPCPFCGFGPVELSTRPCEDGVIFKDRINCPACGIVFSSGWAALSREKSLEMGREAWARRGGLDHHQKQTGA